MEKKWEKKMTFWRGGGGGDDFKTKYKPMILLILLLQKNAQKSTFCKILESFY